MIYNNYLDKDILKFKEIKSISFDEGMIKKTNSNLPFGTCESVYNFDFSTGVLKDGIGISDIEVQYGNESELYTKTLVLPNYSYARSCFFSRCWNAVTKSYSSYYIFHASNNKFYYNIFNSNNSEFIEIGNIEYSYMPNMMITKIQGKDNFLFSNSGTGMYMWSPRSDNAEYVNNTYRITDMCIYNNRNFATFELDKQSILYSQEFNPLNFKLNKDESGYIDIPYEIYGKCNKVIVFKDELYVIRDFNIAKIVKGTDKKNFEVEQLNVCNSRIYYNTVCVCDDKIMFLASDGIYEFDGNNAKKIPFEFDNMIGQKDTDYYTAGYLDGIYYLSFKVDFGDNTKFLCENLSTVQNNAFVKIDVKTYKYSIFRGLDVRQFVVVKDQYNNFMIATYKMDVDLPTCGIVNISGNIKQNPLGKFWVSKMSDLGYPGKVKFIKDIKFITKSDIKLKIYLDDKAKIFNIKGKNKIQKIKINEKANLFGFGFETEQNNCYITNPTLTVGVYDR